MQTDDLFPIQYQWEDADNDGFGDNPPVTIQCLYWNSRILGPRLIGAFGLPTAMATQTLMVDGLSLTGRMSGK